MSLKKCFSLFLAYGLWLAGMSQEIDCNVQVNATQVEAGDKAVFDALQRSVFEFMNNRRWTTNKFETNERISMTVLITVNKQLGTGQYEADFTVSSSRPVFGTTYSSPMFMYLDEKVPFRYLQFDVLDYSENAYLNELTSLLAFYTYTVLAMDHDSYSLLGGQEFWQSAQRVVTNAQSGGGAGWNAFSSRNNRYWLAQNYLNDRFKGLRECNYAYHRLGLDAMSENVVKGRSEVLKALKMISKVHQAEPNSFNVRLFFTAKNDEIVKLFSKAEPAEKNEVVTLLDSVDPANSLKYTSIREGGR